MAGRWWVATAVILAGCAANPGPSAPTADSATASLPPDYLAAVARAEADDLPPSPHLVSLRPGNRALSFDRGGARVLVATVTTAGEFPPGRRPTLKVPVWVTPAPQAQRICRRYVAAGGADPQLRLRQYVGLPPGSGEDVMVSFYAPVRRMFRPTPDPRVDNRRVRADPAARPNAAPDFPGFRRWYLRQRAGAYDPSAPYPWTGRGYTYDWGDPGDPVGGSEFVVRAGTRVAVTARQSPAAYCTP